MEYNGWENRKLIEFFCRYARLCFERYKNKVKYWIPFNEINMSLHLPYTGGAIFIEKSDNELQTIFQALHHQFVASALSARIAREINTDFQIGSMLGISLYYPKTNKPEDILAAQNANRINYFFLDILSKGHYPEYVQSYWNKKNVVVTMKEDDLKILQDNTVDFNSFSYYYSLCTSANPENEKGLIAFIPEAEEIDEFHPRKVRNDNLEVTDWGFQIRSFRIKSCY